MIGSPDFFDANYKNNVVREFDRLSPFYKSMNLIMSLGLDGSFRRKGLQHLVTIIQKFSSSPERVLDIGYGDGSLTAVLREYYPNLHFIGLDLSLGMMKEDGGSRHRFSNISLIRADCTYVPLKSNCISVCVNSFMLRHVQDLNRLLREISSVLSSNGFFYILDMGKRSSFFSFLTDFYIQNITRLLTHLVYSKYLADPAAYISSSYRAFPNLDGLVDILVDNNFHVESSKGFYLGSVSSIVCRVNS